MEWSNISFQIYSQIKRVRSRLFSIIDLDSRQNGFQVLKEDDPIIKLLLSQEEDYIFAEEEEYFTLHL